MNAHAIAMPQVSFRFIGWLAVVMLIAAALLGPTTPRTLANDATDLTLVDVTTECQEAGFDFGFKLDGIDMLTEGTFTASDENHEFLLTIELIDTDDDGEVDDFNVISATPTPDGEIVKQPNVGGGISHITFCFDDEPDATPTPTPDATPTPTPAPTGGVGGATGAPTLPPTDSLPGGASQAPSTDGLRLVLMGMPPFSSAPWC